MVFFSALDQKTAQFNFASSSRLVYHWMQLILFFLQLMVGKNEEGEKKLPLDLLSDQVIMLDDPITSQTAKSIGRSI